MFGLPQSWGAPLTKVSLVNTGIEGILSSELVFSISVSGHGVPENTLVTMC
jgi:hypothetical protein